jgi:type IV secretion system protein VirB10
MNSDALQNPPRARELFRSKKDLPMTRIATLAALTLGMIPLAGQQTVAPAESEPGLIPRQELPADAVVLPRGTRVPLAIINSISTKNSAPGDKLYLQSVYPVVVNGRILVPPGTYVSGVVTEVKRPGRVKGRGELHLRFEQMILPNGVIRDFSGSIAALDGASDESLDRESGKVESEGGKGEDAQGVVRAAGAGAAIGTIAGAAGGSPLRGLGIGSVGGVAAGLIGVLLTRGPEALLERGSQVEMVLDRDIPFTEQEMTFTDPLRRRPGTPTPGAPGSPTR